jgi:hypothetical protein
MTTSPACVSESDQFPHKAEVAAALAAGAHVRRDERELVSNSLLGTYQIRLQIAQNLKPLTEQAQHQEQAINDLGFLVGRLSQHPEAPIAVWYIHALSGARYVLMENAQSNVTMGCIAGPSNISFKADGFAAA